MKPYKTLIFDIGDVIVDIDYTLPVNAFQLLSPYNFSEIVSYSRQHRIFDQFEKGLLTANDFRKELKQFLYPNVTDDQINAAWNSILIGYPAEKLELLGLLKHDYRVLALSNINEIHIHELNRVAAEKFNTPLFADFFHKAYYSNETGVRKPEKEIYTLVLEQENLVPHETFFVDDKAENVAAAKEVGIHAYQLTNRNELSSLLRSLKIV